MLKTLLKKEFLEQLRANKILIIAILILFVAISSPVFAKLTPELLKNINTPGLTINIPTPTYRDSIDQFIKNLSQLFVFVLVFVLAGAIADEKSKKTLEILLSKPVSRSKFILSKFLAYFLTLSTLYVIGSLIFYYYTVIIFGSFSFGHFALLSLLMLLNILLISAVTLFGSAISRSLIAAAGIGFGGLILFNTLISMIKKIADYSPDFILKNYKLLDSGWDNKFLPSLIITLVLIIFFMISSVYLFRKQEIER